MSNSKIKEGDWVAIKTTGDIGVVEKIKVDGVVFVRVPSLTDWPFPKWEATTVANLKKARRVKPPKPQPVYEEALL